MDDQHKNPSAELHDAGPRRKPTYVIRESPEEGKYIEAYGHRYHPSGKIFLPFDEDEQRRMETQHRLFRRCLNGALTATRLPLDVERILDLGSGTGVWPIEMAARYPQVQFQGIDISPIQRTSVVPPNVKFTIDDIENPWDCPSGSLDFIHGRSIAGGVRDWPALLRQAYEKLKPGGLLELTEIAISIHDFDGKFADAELCPGFLKLWRDLSKEVNMEFDPTPQATEWLLEAGFEKIVQQTEILPLGNWAQDEKLKAQQNLMNEITSQHFVNHGGLMFATCGWERSEYDAVAPTFFEDIMKTIPRPYTMAIFTTARKPREE
ncbi:S-adenosyl-L-methionine-dependent methyltransferase [Biscogniauxia mediterranea]|nr:S-adenosyl-L-methionine-dependent methyltransferase [Biscogniauxia mediterranea]